MRMEVRASSRCAAVPCVQPRESAAAHRELVISVREVRSAEPEHLADGYGRQQPHVLRVVAPQHQTSAAQGNAQGPRRSASFCPAPCVPRLLLVTHQHCLHERGLHGVGYRALLLLAERVGETLRECDGASRGRLQACPCGRRLGDPSGAGRGARALRSRRRQRRALRSLQRASFPVGGFARLLPSPARSGPSGAMWSRLRPNGLWGGNAARLARKRKIAKRTKEAPTLG